MTIRQKLKDVGLSLVIFAAATTAAYASEITGAGSTFVYPIISKWSAAYNQKTGDRLNYQSIGSGGGLAQIKAATVDFGASDMPMKWCRWSTSTA